MEGSEDVEPSVYLAAMLSPCCMEQLEMNKGAFVLTFGQYSYQY